MQLQIDLESPTNHLDSAIALAFRYSLTVSDAVYAALARSSGIPLITAHYKFHSKVKDLPFIEALRELEILAFQASAEPTLLTKKKRTH